MKEYGGGSCAKCAKKLRLKKEEKRGQKQDPPTPTKFSSSGCLSKMGDRRFRTLVRYQ